MSNRIFRSLARREQDRCPYVSAHEYGPDLNYAAWFDWAEERARTHVQVACPGCGYFVLWIPSILAGTVELRGEPS